MGFKRRDPAFVARRFADHAPTGSLTRDALGGLLCSLGIDPSHLDEEAPSEEDPDGSMDLPALLGLLVKPTALRQWAASMPLAELLADALQRALPGEGDPLREASELVPDAIGLVCEAVRGGLERMLAEQARALREGFALMAAAETNRAAGKYTVVSMSAGTADDYHRGLEGRIGTYAALVARVRPRAVIVAAVVQTVGLGRICCCCNFPSGLTRTRFGDCLSLPTSPARA